MTLRGNTRDFPLDVLLRLFADTKKTGELAIRGGAGEGALGFADGRLVAAVFGDEPPVPALGAVFDLNDADFEFTPWNDAPQANLEGDLDTLRTQAAEHKKWLASVREVIPDDRMRFHLSERAADQGAVTFTADRWRVVLAVNGLRDVHALAGHLGIDRNAALDLLAGLVRDGVIETVEPPEPEPAPPPPQVSEPAAPAFESPAAEVPPASEATASQWAETPPPPATEAGWSATAQEAPPAEPVYEPAPPAEEPAAVEPPATDHWAPAAPVEETRATDQWTPAAPMQPDQSPPAPMDDRLAALFGTPPSAPAPEAQPSPAPDQWASATDQWAPPAPARDAWAQAAPEAPAAPAEDPRLAAMTAPVAEAPAAPEAPVIPANEWASPPAAAEAPKKGIFGLFRRDEAAPEPATPTTLVDRTASTRAGLLAAFSNALLTEYNSGHYGKNRVDDRIPSLLMRVDEQADPIDRPLPVVDDRLDVQALERSRLAETQSVPYLATLVATIYSDAEKAFGRDKAKRGYKAAQQHVFGGDLSALAAPDVAGKLPKV